MDQRVRLIFTQKPRSSNNDHSSGLLYALGSVDRPHRNSVKKKTWVARSYYHMKMDSLNVKVQQKLKELESLQQIRDLTKHLNVSLEEFAGQIELLGEEAGSIETVTQNWMRIIRAVSLASNSLSNYKEEDYETERPMTERLVRCKIDESQKIITKN
ncbi:hypothetical protein KL928_004059 [Ogataea angusta]|uniref:DASH complex subunit DAD2 n=1 Tax=Pichia angusta TaxID=870730 RepID=A0AAN6DCT9_PICAN|nr:uncharacterized protein KL928_004059 [Ogataea angusta]KAG7817324.1 hypothetical protein KL928_004059 [Ogataea angusta]